MLTDIDDELLVSGIIRSTDGPKYNQWHQDLLLRHSTVLNDVFPQLEELSTFLEQDTPINFAASRAFTEELFDDPSSIERADALPERGRDLFIYLSLHEFKRRNPGASLVFENLFSSVANAQVGSATVRLTGDPRYVSRKGTLAELEQFWAPILTYTPRAYRYLSPELRRSLVLTRQVCRLIPSLYQYATGEARADVELAHDVCSQDGLLLGYCNDTLAGDLRIVSVALEQNRGAALYISGALLRDSEQFKKVQNLLQMKNLSSTARQHDQVLFNCIAAGHWDGDAVEVERELKLCRHLIHAQGDVLEACAAYFREDPELARVTRNIVPPDNFGQPEPRSSSV